jgi:hypothetical protein
VTARCRGANSRGERCGRQPAPGRDVCYLHSGPSDPEPAWRYGPWDRPDARRTALLRTAGAIRDAELAGEFDGPLPTRPCENHLLRVVREARAWLARHDPEWLELADSGALRNAAGKRPSENASRPRECGPGAREEVKAEPIEGLPPGAVKREDGSWFDPATGDEYDVEEVEGA